MVHKIPLSLILLNYSCNKCKRLILPFFKLRHVCSLCHLAWQARIFSFYFRKLLLLTLTIHLYQCIPTSKYLHQLKTINKNNKSFIPIILNKDFSISNNFQIKSIVVARAKEPLLLAFEKAFQHVPFLCNYIQLR